MAKLLSVNWFHFCEYASLSQENKFSLSGIFDELRVSKVPARFPRFFIAAAFQGAPNSEHTITLRVVDPVGKKTLELSGPPIKLAESGKSNFLVDLGNMPILEIGEYKVEILEKDRMVFEEKLAVVKFVLNQKNGRPLN
jgi:hypothetical protein